ncbi:MAG TPA: amidohydrolase family protein [Gemmatimonadaceae bacterium]|nr:amidohydrolase family protein [Gemmatimonadaceae bacterium]
MHERRPGDRALSRIVFLAAISLPAIVTAQVAPVTIRAGLLLDGKGGQLRNALITVVDGKIRAVRQYRSAAVTYDLSRYTVLPGLIDAHVHLTGYINSRGRLHTEGDGDTPAQSAIAAAANAWTTLRSGFTTVQSMGTVADKDLRDAIAGGKIAGPRILTSLSPIADASLTPAQLRARVRDLKAAGADFIKIFASKSLREGGAPKLTPAQLEALCGEAKLLGLRTVVHAHSVESIRLTALAGCGQVEHGIFATPEVLRLLADHGVLFDPQCGLVVRNYLDNRSRFDGVGSFNAEGFTSMERVLPLFPKVLQMAFATPKLRVVFGTDVVAGAHGRNAEDLICRVQEAGQSPMDAIVTATSRNAESMGLGDRIGVLSQGFEADLIALDGNPLRDIGAVKRVVFVMKGGKVFRGPESPLR